MWGDSWINLNMKMIDMPHFRYKKKNEGEEDDIIEGTEEIIRTKFAKYIEP